MAFKIIIDDRIPFIKGALDRYADVEYCKASEINCSMVADADALIIRTRTLCNKDLLKGSSVKFIASATIGFDHIDTEYCKQQGISWVNAPGCNAGSVAQYIASALLKYAERHNIDLTQRVLGVIGVGNVGRKIVRLAEVLDMHVVLNDPPRVRNEGVCGYISLEGVLREADILSFHVPLSYDGGDSTYHMVNNDFLNNINQGTILVNTSRGEVIDTAAIHEAQKGGRLGATIFDVWENEPAIDSKLLTSAAIATPHIAGYSADGKANGTTMAVRAVSEFFDLGLDNWEPHELPAPKIPELFCNGKGKSFQQILTELVLQTYNVEDDMKALLVKPTEFELLRSNYPIRREFSAFKLILENVEETYKRKLLRLGFK